MNVLQNQYITITGENATHIHYMSDMNKHMHLKPLYLRNDCRYKSEILHTVYCEW